MEIKYFEIKTIPTVIYGKQSDKVYFFIHGNGGNKEEGEDLAKYVCKKGWQVLSIDLPEHGERKNEEKTFYPWNTISELKLVMNYIHKHWSTVSLRANSIGAWLSMLSFPNEIFETCLFVSPIIDMEKLILNMMKVAGVSLERLEKEKEIATDFAQTLSWEYYKFAKQNPIINWNMPTSILYGSLDNFTDRLTIENFSIKFNCKLSIMKNGEHWFHTEEEMDFLHKWIESEI